ncbi:MAG: hypothetical protein ACKN9K_15915, partial [Dolichospermum sp.]
MVEYPQENILVIAQLQQQLNGIGLVLSESQFSDLNRGKIVLLEDLELSQLGSIFIMAAAFFAKNQTIDKTAITFKDLPKKAHDCSSCPGIPLCCCPCQFTEQIHCVYLSFINGIPALKICCHIKG